MNYDVIVVGAGPTGVYACYELTRRTPGMKILLIDKGVDIYKRRCPIMEGKLQRCPQPKDPFTLMELKAAGCKPSCSVISGFGGAGAFSDGKFNITTEFGGWLTQYLAPSQVMELIEYVDSINLEHGATEEITDPLTDEVMEIEKKAYGAGLRLLRAKVRHLGTDRNLEIQKSIYTHLQEHIDMLFMKEVQDLIVEDVDGKKHIRGILMTDGKEFRANTVIVAPGRDGSVWLEKILRRQGLRVEINQVDVGVRVETADIVMRDINRHLYEGKFIYSASVGTMVRTFCSNPSGHVVVENHSGIMAANGHSFRDPALKSQNTNFALLVSHQFTEPFSKPNEYAREICKHANDLSGGTVILQRFGDILRGRRSTQKRISEGFVSPTLDEAVPGDLGLVLPYNTMVSLIEMLKALDTVMPGLASDHTLFYGVEAKFYSARPKLSESFETQIKGLFAAGDGAGITRGLAQAGAAGVWIARNIAAHY